MTQKKVHPKAQKCLTLLSLEMPRWPVEENAFKHLFREKGSKPPFDKETFAEKIVAGLSKYLMDQLESPVRSEAPAGKSAPQDNLAAMSSTPTCWYTHSEIRLCEDENGNVYWCLCEHYECDDGSDYWVCSREEF